MFFREKLMSPHQPNPTPSIPTRASISAHTIIQELGSADIIYQVWSKDIYLFLQEHFKSTCDLENEVLATNFSLASHHYTSIINTHLYE